MNAVVDILVAGCQSGIDETTADREGLGRVTVEASTLADLSGEMLNDWCQTSETEYVALMNDSGTGSDSSIEAALGALTARRAAAAALVPFAGDGAWEESWQGLPPRLVLLTTRPETRASMVIRRAALEQTGPFQAVAAPIWDWLIRASSHGADVLLVLDEAGSAAGPSYADLPQLVPAGPCEASAWLFDCLRGIDPQGLLARITSRDDAVAVKAGLLQFHDDLDESHQLSQSIEGRGRHRAGDYWHAIMHRREPDYSNSKYWFSRVDRHPLFEELAPRAAAVLEDSDSDQAGDWLDKLAAPEGWDPFAFVDLCQHCARSKDAALEAPARQIQWIEMLLLLRYTYNDACT